MFKLDYFGGFMFVIFAIFPQLLANCLSHCEDEWGKIKRKGFIKETK